MVQFPLLSLQLALMALRITAGFQLMKLLGTLKGLIYNPCWKEHLFPLLFHGYPAKVICSRGRNECLGHHLREPDMIETDSIASDSGGRSVRRACMLMSIGSVE
mmetsp:Transcript_2520/g.4347  ORF Transcript_2520/g.4347 Transcript_2520/m.4347 type:complete len:104 (+) Transcript_2520:347-658(+)